MSHRRPHIVTQHPNLPPPATPAIRLAIPNPVIQTPNHQTPPVTPPLPPANTSHACLGFAWPGRRGVTARGGGGKTFVLLSRLPRTHLHGDCSAAVDLSVFVFVFVLVVVVVMAVVVVVADCRTADPSRHHQPRSGDDLSESTSACHDTRTGPFTNPRPPPVRGMDTGKQTSPPATSSHPQLIR